MSEESTVQVQFTHSLKISDTAKEYKRKWQKEHYQKVKDTPEFKAMKKESDRKYFQKNKNRTLKHEGRTVRIQKERKGVCEQCGARKGIEVKQTQFHHIKYENDLSLHTVELCASCHRKESARQQGQEKRSEIAKIARSKLPKEALSKGGLKTKQVRKWVYNRRTGKLQIRRGYVGN